MLLAVVGIIISVTAYVSEAACMKISMNGEVKQAKNIAEGEGICFTLPPVSSSEFILKAIELAIFEKGENDELWHIYKDNDGNESKKNMINDPQYLTFNVQFTPEDYRERCKYKITYRYFVASTDDPSLIMISGEKIKDGWRLVGEPGGTEASDDGFVFYKNAVPQITLNGLTFTKRTDKGDSLTYLQKGVIGSNYLPQYAFSTGVVFDIDCSDYDNEDTLSLSYEMRNANTGEYISSSVLSEDKKIVLDVSEKRVKIKFKVSDNYGASSETEWQEIFIDNEPANVTSEFDDMGYYVKGLNLYSKFTVEDDTEIAMTDGYIVADIRKDGNKIKTVELTNNGNGNYTLDENVSSDGEYAIMLNIYDKAGNVSEHEFIQKLDNTAPGYSFVSSSEETEVTEYSTWMNVSKKIKVNMYDSLSGIRKYNLQEKGKSVYTITYSSGVKQTLLERSVTTALTGKIAYRLLIHDNAKTLDKTANNVRASSTGNLTTVTKNVWLDKTNPVISLFHNSEDWQDAGYSINADFYDYSSTTSVNDASGVFKREYAVTDSEYEPDLWSIYTGAIEFNTGGIKFLHLRCIDYAGNVTVVTRKVKVNEKSVIMGDVVPTDEYKHTIYYTGDKLYVVKNTAYNTKYRFAVSDNDTDDIIRADIRLINLDDESIYKSISAINNPAGDVMRDITFNISYLKENGEALPDGVYKMVISITEIKEPGEEITSHENKEACEVVIKRNSPPTPVISVSDSKVNIDYPAEPLAGSLNSDIIKSLYKRQYKTVKTGDAESNVYRTYNGEFDIDNFTVTALYTDIAGNSSISSQRIFKEDGNSAGGIDKLTTTGNNTTVEEGRNANVYYIGIRREKQRGINSDIFEFIK